MNKRLAKHASPTPPSREQAWLESMTRLLDTRFRIPGTRIRFGADFLLGLIPGAGDVVSMAVSGTLVATMAKQGVSPRLLARMLGNVVLDTVVGSIPLVGNIFDLFFKANSRNLRLMQEHYVEGKHRGSAWPVLAVFLLIALALMSATLLISIWLWHRLANYLNA